MPPMISFLFFWFFIIGLFGNNGVFTFLMLKKLLTIFFASVLGGILSASLRFLSHVLSGVFAFSTYAGELNPWIYSLGYNSFVFIDIAIAIVAGVLVFSSKTFLRELKK